MDMLQPHQQIALKAASVIGREFSAEALAAIHPSKPDPAVLVGRLEALIGTGFVIRLPGDGGARFAFYHRVLRDVVHGMLTESQRRPLHAQVARLLEREHAGAMAPYLGAIAKHWEEAGDFDKAVAFGERAAQHALAQFANVEALATLSRIRMLAKRGTVSLSEAQMARLAWLSGQACQGLAQFRDAAGHFTECLRLENIPTRTGRRAILLNLPVEALKQCLRRCGLARRPVGGGAAEKARTAAQVYTRFAEHAYFNNDTLGLLFYTLAALNEAERAGVDRETVEGLGAIAIGLGISGWHSLARAYKLRSVQLAERVGDPALAGFSHLLATVYSLSAGDWRATRLHSEAGARLSEQAGSRIRRRATMSRPPGRCGPTAGTRRRSATSRFAPGAAPLRPG
jgi:hypothetical protein